jgi:hypothetical protein
VNDGNPRAPGRRRFLGALTGIGLLASVCPAPAASPRVSSSIRGLAIALASQSGVCQIGAAHLRAHPPLASEDRLLQELLDSATPSCDFDVDSVAKALDDAIALDFEYGRVALVDGWCLSLTELRFCALCSLVAVAS